MDDVTTVYTDGACSGNPGPGGWAWVVPDGPYASGAEAHTTNQRMELRAVIEAARALSGGLRILSDSTYVVNCFRDRWWEGWLRRGWVNSQKKPVANRDLWEPLIELYRSRHMTFEWVKGHSADRWNDLADRLAVEAALAQRGRAGTGTPDALGPSDEPGPGSSAAGPRAREIAGHALVVVGHRPPELGGYGETETARSVRDRLESVIDAKRTMHDDLVVVTGLNLGAETLAAEAARATGVPYEVVLAHPGQDSPWPEESRRRFTELLNGARNVRTLQRSTPDTRPKIAGSYARRDAWLRRNADEAIAVWAGEDDFVGKSVRALSDELGEENVWILHPAERV